MSLIAPTSSKPTTGKRDPLEIGNYPAFVSQVIDCGLQAQDPYEGVEKEPVREIMVTYEFADEFLKDENGDDILTKPIFLSEFMPLKEQWKDNAKSTIRMKAIDPNNNFGFDWSLALSTPIALTVAHTKTGNPKVGGVGQLRAKELEKMGQPINPPKMFVLDTPDMEVFGSLPTWVQDKIKGNLEFKGSALETALAGGNSTPAPTPAPVAETPVEAPTEAPVAPAQPTPAW